MCISRHLNSLFACDEICGSVLLCSCLPHSASFSIVPLMFVHHVQMLHKQLGIVDFAPFKQQFLAAFSRSRVALQTTASIPGLLVGIQRNWKDADTKSSSPIVNTSLHVEV